MTSSGALLSVVVTADQVDSRRRGDRVPDALAGLKDIPRGSGGREFARTAGDEIQGLLTDSGAVISVLEALARLGDWRVGVGIGEVERPVARDVRAATGPAFVNARSALTAARTAPGDLALVGPEPATGRTQAALWLLHSLWRRRTPAGWEVVAAAATAGSQQEIAAQLGITASAVSQRLRSAGHAEGAAGRQLAVDLLDAARRT